MWTQMHFARAPAKADGQSATSSTAAKTAVDEKQKGRWENRWGKESTTDREMELNVKEKMKRQDADVMPERQWSETQKHAENTDEK